MVDGSLVCMALMSPDSSALTRWATSTIGRYSTSSRYGSWLPSASLAQ